MNRRKIVEYLVEHKGNCSQLYCSGKKTSVAYKLGTKYKYLNLAPCPMYTDDGCKFKHTMTRIQNTDVFKESEKELETYKKLDFLERLK